MADLLKAIGPLPVTDGESISPESHRSSVSGPDGLRVVYYHIRVDLDAIFPTSDMFSGCSDCRSLAGDAECPHVRLFPKAETQETGSLGWICHPNGSLRKDRLTLAGPPCDWTLSQRSFSTAARGQSGKPIRPLRHLLSHSTPVSYVSWDL